jgi:hypothetical protein
MIRIVALLFGVDNDGLFLWHWKGRSSFRDGLLQSFFVWMEDRAKMVSLLFFYFPAWLFLFFSLQLLGITLR